MDGDYNRKLIKIFLKVRSFFTSKNVLTFSLFLLLSAAFWFINALNKEREFFITVPLEYTDLPKNIFFEEELPSELSIKVRELGMRYWTYARKKSVPVKITFQPEYLRDGNFNLSGLQLLSVVSHRLMSSTKVLAVYPEMIQVAYQNMHAKKIPVYADGKLELEGQYMLCSDIQITPDSVEVYGIPATLDTMTGLFTESFVIKNRQDTLNEVVSLKPIPDVRFSVDQVVVSALIDMFTEKTATLPVQLINNPEHISLISFPTTVKAVFNISIKHFNEFYPGDIQVVMDYNDLNQINSKRSKLKIINNKPYISNIRIQPEDVEILLIEK